MNSKLILLFTSFLMVLASVSSAEIYDLTVCEIQTPDEGGDSSIWIGDTVRTSGVVIAGTGLYYAGAGKTFYMQDTDCGPLYSGLMAYDETGVQFPDLFPGDSITVVGVVSEYLWMPPVGYDPVSHTELFIITGGFTFHPGIHPEPQPFEAPVSWFDSTGHADSLSEGIEAVLTVTNDITVDSLVDYGGTATWICYNDSGYIVYIREASDSIEGAFMPPVGTVLSSVTGVVYHRFGLFHLQPRYQRDIIYESGAPIISQTRATPPYPMPDDEVVFTTTIFDPDPGGDIEEAAIFLRVNPPGSFNDYELERDGNRYSYTVPAGTYNDGDLVNYYIFASDIAGENSYDPTQAPVSYYQFPVHEPIVVTIAEAKADEDEDFIPDLLNTPVQVTGIVTATTFADTSTNIYIQDATAGINVFYGPEFLNVSEGDSVTVTGIVDQYNGKTEIVLYRADRLVNHGPGSPVDPITIQCADLGPVIGEETEGLLVTVINVTLTPEPDPWPIIGQSANMTITDATGSATLRIDRYTNINQYPEPSSPMSIIGIVGQYDPYIPYDSSYQLMPRKYEDFGDPTGVNDNNNNLPRVFVLNNNYPNPFNPATAIHFELPQESTVDISIYDIMGRKVVNLVDAIMAAGKHCVSWDGTNENGTGVSSGIYFYSMRAGDFSAVKKMTILK